MTNSGGEIHKSTDLQDELYAASSMSNNLNIQLHRDSDNKAFTILAAHDVQPSAQTLAPVGVTSVSSKVETIPFKDSIPPRGPGNKKHQSQKSQSDPLG